MNKTGSAYESERLDLSGVVDRPSYQVCIEWMKELPEARPETFDFWARGNFVRHLLYHRRGGSQPIFVEAGNPEEMRWVYRRLALAGVALELIYTGPLSKPQWIKHWQPLDDVVIDCGWGYIAFAGTIVRSPSGRRYWPVLGYASLMPAEILQWLAEEAEQAFTSGRLFIAPAELIGLNRAPRVQHLRGLADMVDGGAVAESVDAALAGIELEIPWIDGMGSADFEKLLQDHRQELQEFQTAFRSLVAGYHASEADADLARRRVSDAVSELMRSSRHAAFRVFVNKCKGTLSTFPAAMGVLGAAGAAYSHDPFAGAAVVAAAGKVLRDLWRQSRSEARASSSSPYRVLLQLGMQKARFVSGPPGSGAGRGTHKRSAKLGPYHWLCPPTCGVRAAVVKK
jgi:hypothetical protein